MEVALALAALEILLIICRRWLLLFFERQSSKRQNFYKHTYTQITPLGVFRHCVRKIEIINFLTAHNFIYYICVYVDDDDDNGFSVYGK